MKKNLILAVMACAFSLSAYAGGNSNSNNSGGDQSQSQQQSQNQSQSSSNRNENDNRNTNLNLNSNHSSSTSIAGAAAGAMAVSNSGGNKLSQGNSQSVSINHESNRPAASAPNIALTSVGTDNCLGSASASVGTGFFSIGGGSTIESVECNRRAYSRALRDLGQTGAAVALLCLNAEVASVTPACAKPAKVSATGEAMPANVQGTKSASRVAKDPFICARTGEQC
jgi:hypothetical protein